MPWIWQSPTWPVLTYAAERLAEPLRRARLEIGRLLGKAEAIGARDLVAVERDVWSNEAVATAAIEGERLDLAGVRSSVARRLGLTPDFIATVPRSTEGLLDVMESAADWDSNLTHERLWRWQAALFPAGGTPLRQVKTGAYRMHDDPMQIVSGPIGQENVHYVAPPSASVRAEMHSFLEWFNGSRGGTLDGILRAGLSHIWFESVHPFEDGNGRVGRAVLDLAFAQDMRRATRLHGVSTELRRRQNEYYDALNTAQRGTGDVTDWLLWFIGVYADSCRTTAVLIDESLVRARFWSDYREVELNQRQRKALNRMLEAGPGRFEGGLTVRKYLNITGAPRTTAWRDLDELNTKGLLVRTGVGRATRYDLSIPGWEWKPDKGGASASGA